MAQSLAKIVIHTVFSTRGRAPFLRDADVRNEMHRYLGGILTRLDCQLIIVGGTEDHVHLLNSLSRTCDPAKMVKELKRGSAVWLKTNHPKLSDFAWQNGYGIFSIGYSQIETARTYISRQEKHHQKVSFQDELRQLLHRYDVPFDEKFIWD